MRSLQSLLSRYRYFPAPSAVSAFLPAPVQFPHSFCPSGIRYQAHISSEKAPVLPAAKVLFLLSPQSWHPAFSDGSLPNPPEAVPSAFSVVPAVVRCNVPPRPIRYFPVKSASKLPQSRGYQTRADNFSLQTDPLQNTRHSLSPWSLLRAHVNLRQAVLQAHSRLPDDRKEPVQHTAHFHRSQAPDCLRSFSQ